MELDYARRHTASEIKNRYRGDAYHGALWTVTHELVWAPSQAWVDAWLAVADKYSIPRTAFVSRSRPTLWSVTR